MIVTLDTLKEHLGVLRRRDKHISHAIKSAGWPGPRVMTPGFATLVRIIGDQQVSTAAGAAIYAKVSRACGGRVTAPAVLRLGEKGLRASGFSGQKTRYILGLAEATAARTLSFAKLERTDDLAVRETLMAFKGIGTWTADIYLMFGMGRADVWPAGDLGLQNAIQMLHGLKVRPSAKDLERVAEPWRPYRSSAALLLWHYFGDTRAKAKAAK